MKATELKTELKKIKESLRGWRKYWM